MRSIRWKLTLGFLSITVLFVGIYIFLAKSTFEADKLSYVFESQQNQVDSAAEILRRDFDRSIFDLRTFAYLASVEQSDREARLKTLFSQDENFLAVDVYRKGQTDALFSFEKTKGFLERIPKDALNSTA